MKPNVCPKDAHDVVTSTEAYLRTPPPGTPERRTVNITYTIDLTPEAWVALERHGYDPLLPARGVAGPPGRIDGALCGTVDGVMVRLPLRNRVCLLDGIEVDGHERSDLDPGSTACIHCDYEGPHP